MKSTTTTSAAATLEKKESRRDGAQMPDEAAASLPDDPALLKLECLRLNARLQLMESNGEALYAMLLDWRALLVRQIQLAKKSAAYRRWRRLAKMSRRASRYVGWLRATHVMAEREAALALIRAAGAFDVGYYSSQFQAPEKFHRRAFRRAASHYLMAGPARHRNPSRSFDGQYYLAANPDVAASGMNPLLHFLQYGVVEGRYPNPRFAAIGGESAIYAQREPGRVSAQEREADKDPLELLLPGVTAPLGIGRLEEVERKLRPVRVLVEENAPRHANIFIPHLHPAIIFGGYTAFFRFLQHLRRVGMKLRFIIVDPMNGITVDEALTRMRDQQPQISAMLEEAEVFAFGDNPQDAINMGRDDVFVAYSAWTAFAAAGAAQQLNRRHFVYFIQEFEPVFHANNSIRILVEQSYRLPHVAVFNSQPLVEYFTANKIGVFDGRDDAFARENSGSFTHVLTPVERPTREELADRSVRRLLFYTRPERHAERNLFEIGTMALRIAISRGHFPGKWEFIGIGSLRASAEVELGGDHVLRISPRLDGELYAAALKSFDVGLSMIYAPHPGVVHYEMAAAGLVVVTNTFVNRTAEDLASISENIIAAPPYVEDLVSALSVAAKRCTDVDARLSGIATIPVRDWSAVFAGGLSQLTRTMAEGKWP